MGHFDKWLFREPSLTKLVCNVWTGYQGSHVSTHAVPTLLLGLSQRGGSYLVLMLTAQSVSNRLLLETIFIGVGCVVGVGNRGWS